jgi:hypothetical protein
MADQLPFVPQATEEEWVGFPGGELEGQPPRLRCSSCRERTRGSWRSWRAIGRSARDGSRKPLCFQCYRGELDRKRTLAAARALDTASEARFATIRPFEPVDRTRLVLLKAERATARGSANSGAARFASQRRQAQIAARRAVEPRADGLKGGRWPADVVQSGDCRLAGAAELQFPASWLPFVISR